MANFAIDSSRQTMTATGIVQSVKEWVETPEGRRRPSDQQARDENTGMPLWQFEVLYTQSSFGRMSTVTAMVTLGAEEEPRPAPLTPVVFTGLNVDIRINKAGGFTEVWTAEGFADAPKPAQRPAPDKSHDTSGAKSEKAA